jgi:hypothetical protein
VPAPPSQPKQGLIEPESYGMRLVISLSPVDLAGEEGLLGLASPLVSHVDCRARVTPSKVPSGE